MFITLTFYTYFANFLDKWSTEPAVVVSILYNVHSSTSLTSGFPLYIFL